MIESASEVYLKLRAIDLRNPAAILAFANEYGVLSVRAHDFAAVLPHLGAEPHVRDLQSPIELARERYPAVDSEGRSAWDRDPVFPAAETISEFQFGAVWLRHLTDAWLLVGGRLSHSGPDEKRVELPSGMKRPWRNVSGAALWLEGALTQAVSPFRPRLMIRSPKDYKDRPMTTETAASSSFAGVPLFSVCALELFNHIVQDDEFKTCELCGRLFVRQEGRAIHGQHRMKGVRFCSARCLRVQKQRDYRARKRVQHKQTSDKGGRDG
jgi:hypothetical protein